MDSHACTQSPPVQYTHFTHFLTLSLSLSFSLSLQYTDNHKYTNSRHTLTHSHTHTQSHTSLHSIIYTPHTYTFTTLVLISVVTTGRSTSGKQVGEGGERQNARVGDRMLELETASANEKEGNHEKKKKKHLCHFAFPFYGALRLMLLKGEVVK